MALKLVHHAEPAPPAAGDALRYWAFLSYSHHDKLVAKRLQRQLETYRVPRRLIGRETSHGPVPERLTPVFRDRDELHAGADLKASVQDALSRSRWLIVVCTPDSARSPWVNREIIEFKKLRGERQVLALIVRGEPFASDMPGREAEECFPPALRRGLNEQGLPEGEPLEPIAADMRKEGDGPRRAMIKLVAGMVGVSFDDLVRRDLQRRVRWLSALAGASVLGVFVFAYMAVMAVQARNEAQSQRVQAEGLIEFMLGDLRKKLEPVGRLEVLDSVGEKALAYYGAQASDKLDATALGHRSRAMHLIGEIRDLRGNPAEAQKAFEQAAETTARLLAQAPNDPQRIFDHAQSVFWVGYAAWKRADGRMAEAKFREYLELGQRLVAIDGSKMDWQAELAFANVNLGMVQLETGRPLLALGALGEAGRLLLDLSRARPALRFELAQSHGWRAKAYELLGDYEQARMEQGRKLELFKAMPDADKDRTAQRGIFNALAELGQYELALGNLAAAELDVRSSLSMSEALVVTDPNNVFWRGGACFARLRLVEILIYRQQGRVASENLKMAADCVRSFNSAGTWSLRYSVVLPARLLTMSAALATEGDRDGVAKNLERLLAEAEKAIPLDAPDRQRLMVEIANAALALGRLRSEYAPDRAREAWLLSARILSPFAANNDGALLTPLAESAFRLGERDRAMEILVRLKASSYRHPAFTELMKRAQSHSAAN